MPLVSLQVLSGTRSNGSADDVVICCAIRTPLTKAKRGGLRNVYPEDLLAVLFKELLRRTQLDPSLIEDVCIGNVIQPGAGALGARIAGFLGGLPNTTSVHTVNRQCSSGLQAVASIAGSIVSGNIDLGIGGNSSQVTDGAALVLLARRSTAIKLNLPIFARFVSFAVAGVDPEVMGVGPAAAIPKALAKAGLSMEDISVFELNEAFASQVAYCIKKLGIPRERLNPNGGAIALGHPLGCTGARQIATLLPELRRRKARYGVVSMCIGTGMGAAAVIENLVR
ncbi:hypothetical protein Emed_000065 [Eimeria media]